MSQSSMVYLAVNGDTLECSSVHQEFFQSLSPELQSLTRNKWKSHPNWFANSFLLNIHNHFRQVSESIYKGISTMDNQRLRSSKDNKHPKLFRSLFAEWQEMMAHHEDIEESKLYPYLCCKFGVDMKYLVKEHRELDALREQIIHCFNQYIQFDSFTRLDDKQEAIQAVWNTLMEKLIHYDKVLRVHLMEEENMVYPMLLSLTMEELNDFHNLSLKELIKKVERQEKAQGLKTQR